PSQVALHDRCSKPDQGLRQARRPRPCLLRGAGARDLRFRGTERRRQNHDASHPGSAARAHRWQGLHRRRRCDERTREGAHPDRIHARFLRRLRPAHARGVPRLLRGLLPAAQEPASEDRRGPARAGRHDGAQEPTGRHSFPRPETTRVPGARAGARPRRPAARREGRGGRGPDASGSDQARRSGERLDRSRVRRRRKDRLGHPGRADRGGNPRVELHARGRRPGGCIPQGDLGGGRMNPVARAVWNPIVAKEYRTRMRTWRSPFAITLYVVLLGGLGWAVFAAMTGNTLGLGGSGTNYGMYLFMFLIVFQVALLGFITPALTAGAISSERERQTLDLLFVTPLAPFSILWGKLLASMSFVVLLLILSIPLFSLVFLLGGIELDQV